MEENSSVLKLISLYCLKGHSVLFLCLQVPSWLTLQNCLGALVFLIAMFFHYQNIVDRFQAAQDEAVRVLENMPEPEVGTDPRLL